RYSPTKSMKRQSLSSARALRNADPFPKLGQAGHTFQVLERKSATNFSLVQRSSAGAARGD
ncbi:hypothetical protein, partial [Stappia sp. WLB 29]|uniref:hypothetical protein n=1 Tax=Stappia sp. WLB 29 TaxID=2925220 RepID=UPI0020C17885